MDIMDIRVITVIKDITDIMVIMDIRNYAEWHFSLIINDLFQLTKYIVFSSKVLFTKC